MEQFLVILLTCFQMTVVLAWFGFIGFCLIISIVRLVEAVIESKKKD